MLRLYDWECWSCWTVQEALTNVPSGIPVPRVNTIWCPTCSKLLLHRRLISLPAPYTGDHAFNPVVYGGRYDTMGAATLPLLPDVPASAVGDTNDYKQLFNSREWREARLGQKKVIASNEQKRARARAAANGQHINMRVDRCAGDPKVSE